MAVAQPHRPLALDELQDALQHAGIDWRAEETEITPNLKNPTAELFGLSITEEERVSLIKEAQVREQGAFMTMAPPPPDIDWRNVNGQNWVTDIQNQRQCGACVAFSTCAALEARVRIREQNAGLAIDLSEAHLFFCGTYHACQQGWNFKPALAHCAATGVGYEADFPYTPHNQNCRPIPSHVWVTRYEEAATELARMQAVAFNGPVIAGMRVFEDFYYYKGGIYRHVAGIFKGLHAVAVVGYNQNERFWIVKNSWGTNWGENGYLRIGFGECGLDTQFPFFDPEVSYTP